MKKLLLLFTFLGFTSGIFAQFIIKTVNLATAGTLSYSLTSGEFTTITELTLTGHINAQDFKTMRDAMPWLTVLNISGVTVAAYNGEEGTSLKSNDYPADAIPNYAFFNTNTMQLQGKISLRTVVLPSSSTSIGEYAFHNCSGLTTVTIPNAITSIGYMAFGGCTGLTTVAIPSSVTSIGNSAFRGCSGLNTVAIPSSVTSIGESAFAFCGGLTSITIPSSVTSIGISAFVGCSGLISVDSNNRYYSSINGVLYNKAQNKVIQCPISKLGSFTIPSSVTSIGEYAFVYCSGLTSITIPSSVTSIERSAFEGCSGLTSITTSRISPPLLSSPSYVFLNVDKTTCILYVPVGSKSAYQTNLGWKDFRNIIEKDFTGVDPIINNQQLTVYPNPTSGKVKLIFDQIPQRGTTLTVNDFTGKTILTQFIQNKVEWIDLGGNSPGVYLINTNLKNYKVQKVILK